MYFISVGFLNTFNQLIKIAKILELTLNPCSLIRKTFEKKQTIKQTPEVYLIKFSSNHPMRFFKEFYFIILSRICK